MKTVLEVTSKRLQYEEGFRGKPYYDINGFQSIMFGRNLDANPFTQQEGLLLLELGIKKRIKKIQHWKAYQAANTARRSVLVDMAYNMGVHRLKGFKRMLKAYRYENWEKAAIELLDSKAARELPTRYNQLARIVRTGEL